MNILKQSRENIDDYILYAMTLGEAKAAMQTLVGSTVEVADWVQYEEERKADDGETEVVTVLSIVTPEGEIYSTISEPFMRAFLNMADFFSGRGKSLPLIDVKSSSTKKGRKVIMCAAHIGE